MTAQAPTISPILRYEDPAAALDWLERAFGFTRVDDDRDEDGNVRHATLRFGTSLVMVSGARDGAFAGPAGSGWAYVVVEDPDAHHARAKDAGAEIVYELTDQDYGSRDYSARDPEGNLWSFGTWRPALTPSSMSASPDSN
jgi:uncharacterized glyoxalase superfamily protein PhnB